MSHLRQNRKRTATRLLVAVIDDDPLVLGLLADMMNDCGHSVACFDSPQEALVACREAEFDAVLCDMCMPQMSGAELYDRLCEARPDYRGRMMLLAGDVLALDTQQFLLRTGCRYLGKPFRRSELENALAAVAALPPKQSWLPKAA